MSKLEYIVEPLLQWFLENQRSLPWRDEPEPYRVWVSKSCCSRQEWKLLSHILAVF